MPEYKRILVIRFSSLGDIILTAPFLKVLRRKFPDAEIDFCTKSRYKDIIRLNPNINRIIETDDNLDFIELSKLRKELTGNPYDLVIDLHNNLRTFYLKFFLGLGTKILVFRKYSFRKFLLVNFKINLLKGFPPISARYINTLKKIAHITSSDLKTHSEFFTNKESRNRVLKILADNGIADTSNIICVVPGTKHFTKTYPAEYYAEIINTAQGSHVFALVGAENDRPVTGKILSGTRKNICDLCGKLNLPELAELMKLSKLVISGDTGPMHIAEALNVPLIALMGSSVKEFGFYPQSENSSVIENVNLSCRPCSHIGKKKCFKGHFKCMMEIKPEAVYFKLNELLSTAV